jgi:predicted Zn-dependent protease
MPSKFGRMLLLLALGLSFLTAACATAPYTGRRQLVLMSEGRADAMGSQAFQELTHRYPICGDPALNDQVFRVGRRIAAAANRPDYHWEFVVLVNDKEANAFCLPGGKVGIFTGLLKYTRDEAGLATVISHEAAHALARHAAERQSQALLAQLGSLGLGLGLGGVSPVAGEAIAQGYSLGTQYGILLPYSRTQELEADKIGLILMAKAGYDPALALDFWRRMMNAPENRVHPPQFMSSHPRDESRIQAMVDFLPKAEQYYVPAVAENPPLMQPNLPRQPAAPVPPGGQAPQAVPPAKPVPAPDFGSDPDDLILKPMDNRNPATPDRAAPCGQWTPLPKE